ncbi:DUF4304 domain-containing protein [Luteolibacter pohnpeiensis]|uniref:DUF4304 domain-containing protein n=1 Tax=Luteolibacter pohnpeiensis TaxID=454153 RepID=A0A934SBL7_9BACT|nr:DUF4304 domain-containing protein [Luteolibacter pohnpeiensis]MBK1884536.1 DUF4304 domain-containing protein [Luteolibacter pohnpeiensis]
MASEEKREFVKAIAPTLKAHGFKKKDATWHRTCDGFIQTFNVQGSQWGKSFYLNLGIYITALGDETHPLEYRCHVRNRVDEVAVDRARYKQLLDFEISISSSERFKELNEIIESRAIPWLEEFSDNRRLMDLISGGQRLSFFVLKSVYDYYGVPLEVGRQGGSCESTDDNVSD